MRAAMMPKRSNLPAQYRTAIVGVLPFANSATADEYFADGLTEDLIHALPQSFYRVLSRSSTFEFKGKSLRAPDRAGDRCDDLIQGTVRRAGAKIASPPPSDARKWRAIMDWPV
jgi:adenylate cyclase